MGKPTLVDLLTLIEGQLDQDPWLGYQTLLELVKLVKSETTYQRYVPMLMDMETSYTKRMQPTLLTPLPITLYRQQPLQLTFEVGRLPMEKIDGVVNGQVLKPSHTGSVLAFEFAHDGVSTLPMTLRVEAHVIATFALTFTSPVEMDNLGI